MSSKSRLEFGLFKVDAEIEVVEPLPKQLRLPLSHPLTQFMSLQISVVTCGNGFILTEKGSNIAVAVGFTSRRWADLFLEWRRKALQLLEEDLKDEQEREDTTLPM